MLGLEFDELYRRTVMENSLATGTQASSSHGQISQTCFYPALEGIQKKYKRLCPLKTPVDFGASISITAKHTADVSLVCRGKRNAKYEKYQEEMVVDASKFFYLFVNMTLITLFC